MGATEREKERLEDREKGNIVPVLYTTVYRIIVCVDICVCVHVCMFPCLYINSFSH